VANALEKTRALLFLGPKKPVNRFFSAQIGRSESRSDLEEKQSTAISDQKTQCTGFLPRRSAVAVKVLSGGKPVDRFFYAQIGRRSGATPHQYR
jgi:hypothetical protein